MNRQTTDRRGVRRIVTGVETRDGAGVQLTRFIGTPALSELDPFLLLDHFHSENPDDYLAGFPSHPHRGFETVTYLLAGRMRHADNAGHSGVIEPGGVQWMTAGRGIVHSEMPEQENGLLSGFQLWVNLPARQKMIAPRYQEFGPGAIAEERRDGGVRVRVIAGRTRAGTAGPVTDLATPVCYLDVELPAGSRFEEPLPTGWNALLCLLQGRVDVDGTAVEGDQLAVLGDAGPLRLEAKETSRLLLIAGSPLGEPVVRHGPFVMNSEAEIRQAIEDYRKGRLQG